MSPSALTDTFPQFIFDNSRFVDYFLEVRGKEESNKYISAFTLTAPEGLRMDTITSERRKADATRSNYAWLENFWHDCIRPRRGRRWEVATLIDGDLALRDG